MNVTLGGDLRATKAPNQQLRLAGRVNAVEARIQFQGRQFTILRDRPHSFDGDPIDQLNPALDLKRSGSFRASRRMPIFAAR